ncbi:nitroreductase family protein [Beggiatoa alba]|nr:nitroreductase family protein [Beggiatoa alba]
MTEKMANTVVPVDALIAQRWSPRAFDSSKAVETNELLALLEAARWAPSCFGEEPWRFIVCDRNQDSAAWEKLLDCLAEKNQLWARNAPLLLLATSVPVFTHNGNPNRWDQYDTGAASVSLCLQATAMGLQAHQMGGFDGDKARAAFSIPDEVDIMAVIAVGYAGPLEALHEDFRSAEMGERARQPMGERFFAGRWGTAYCS